jgi:hypothetical protein
MLSGSKIGTTMMVVAEHGRKVVAAMRRIWRKNFMSGILHIGKVLASGKAVRYFGVA